MINKVSIYDTFLEVTTTGAGKLNGKELAFIRSIYAQSQSHGFTALSKKQAAWFNAIAKKLEATKGFTAFDLASKRNQGKLQRYRNSYRAACIGW